MKTLLLLALAASLSAGCIRVQKHSYKSGHATTLAGTVPSGPQERIAVVYHYDADHAMLESERFTLVFEDFSKAEREMFHLHDGRAWIQVAGSGHSSVTTSCRRNLTLVEFKSAYVNGTNTIEFGPHTLRLVDGGKRLLVKNTDVDLSSYHCVRLNGKDVKVE